MTSISLSPPTGTRPASKQQITPIQAQQIVRNIFLLPSAEVATLSPTYTLTKTDPARGRTVSRVFVGTEELIDYIASLGPAEPVEDRAGGFPHQDDRSVMCLPLPDGRCALVDLEDYDLVKSYAWLASEGGRVQTTFSGEGGVFTLRMHRLIFLLGANDERVVDHINHDPLDNRKANLRVCTQQQNTFNTRLSKSSSTGIKGVSRYGKKWRGAVTFGGEKHSRYFDTPQEAEDWVIAKRQELHGDFACHG